MIISLLSQMISLVAMIFFQNCISVFSSLLENFPKEIEEKLLKIINLLSFQLFF